MQTFSQSKNILTHFSDFFFSIEKYFEGGGVVAEACVQKNLNLIYLRNVVAKAPEFVSILTLAGGK